MKGRPGVFLPLPATCVFILSYPLATSKITHYVLIDTNPSDGPPLVTVTATATTAVGARVLAQRSGIALVVSWRQAENAKSEGAGVTKRAGVDGGGARETIIVMRKKKFGSDGEVRGIEGGKSMRKILRPLDY